METREVPSSRNHDCKRAQQNRSVSASVTSHRLAMIAGLQWMELIITQHVTLGYLAAIR